MPEICFPSPGSADGRGHEQNIPCSAREDTALMPPTRPEPNGRTAGESGCHGILPARPDAARLRLVCPLVEPRGRRAVARAAARRPPCTADRVRAQIGRRVIASRNECGQIRRRSYVVRRSFGLIGRPRRPSRAKAAHRAPRRAWRRRFCSSRRGRAFTSSAARSMAAAWDLVGPCRRATASSWH
jgi:hypothetical protein